MRMEDKAFGLPTASQIATATNGIATATVTCATGTRIVVTQVKITASAAPAAAVAATLTTGTARDRWEIPAAAFAPVVNNYTRPLDGGANTNVVGVLPALGAGVIGTIVIHYYVTNS